jgi:hypothetical protein
MGPMEQKNVVRWLSGMVAVVFVSSHVVWAHSAESNFWSERAEMSRRMRSGMGPAVPGFLAHLPTVERRISSGGISSLGDEWSSVLGQHGTVGTVSLRSGAPVFYVQDVHGHRTAQENLAEILLSFLSRYPQAPVVLEGAAGPVSLEKGRGESVDANRGAAAFFFNTGVISGAEYAVLAAPVQPSVFGGEDASLYRKNRLALDQAHLLKASFEKRLTDWQKRVASAKESVFSAELNTLDRRLSPGAKGEDFVDRVTYLAGSDRLPSPPSGSALALFLEVAALEKSFSLDRVSRDRSAFIETLSQSLTPPETDDLARAALALRAGEKSPGAFYEKLKNFAQHKGVSLQKFPDFHAYVRYVLLADQVRPEQLQKELEEREEALWSVMAHTPAQRDLHRLDRDMSLVNGLLNLTLTPAEWEHFQERRNEIHRIPSRLAEGSEVVDFGPFEGFYEAAQKRNEALVKNTVAALDHAPTGTPVLLVAGGFHSAGVARLLSDRNVGLVVVSPRFSDVADAPGAFGLFYRDRTPLELLFDSPRVTLSETLALSPLTDEGKPRAQAFAALSGPLREALASGTGDGAQSVVSGSTLIDVRDRDFPAKEVEGAIPVLTDVPTGIGKNAANARLVSVCRLTDSGWRRAWNALKKGTTKILGVALLGAVLLPFSGLPEAHAYGLTTGPQGVQVVVQKGEHLWGAATHVLKARGVEKPSNLQIAREVKDLAERNGIKNPNRILPGVSYQVAETSDSGGQGKLVQTPSVESDSPTVEPDTKAAAEPEAGPQGKAPPLSGDVSKSLPSLLWGFVVAIGVPVLVSVLSPGRARPRLNVRDAVGRVLSKMTPMLRRNLMFGALLVGGMWGLSWIMAGGIPLGTADQFVRFLMTQWPVELALSMGLAGAVYFVWFRAKEINLSPVQQSEPRLREWGVLLERMKERKDLSEEDVSRLVNNLHSLLLNNRITAAAISDRGVLERRIDIYRALSRLSYQTVLFLDRRLAKGTLPPTDAARVLDVREKFFLHQLYGLKVSNALVPASVTHWALSNFERQDSWFEQRKVGALLRLVRGVPSMIRGSVQEYKSRLLEDTPTDGKTLWEQAEGLSVVSLGNILVPGLYAETDKKALGEVFSLLAEKTKTKELPDMSAKDLHRKGWGTLTSLLIWGVAVSQMSSLFAALLTFVTGVGVTMVLFRLQALGVRRDGFFRESIDQWRDMNRGPHQNGRTNGTGVGEDPFHLNRDFARHHFDAAEKALELEMGALEPSADVVLLIAQNDSQRRYFEEKAKDMSLFRQNIPVVVLTVPEGRGSFYAYARAWTYLSSEEFDQVKSRYSHLRGKRPWEMGVVTLVPKADLVEGMTKPLGELPSFVSRIGAEKLGNRTLFDLAVMNAYRATQAGKRHDQGGLVLRWADRAYVGPVRVSQGPGVCLETQWANRAEMSRFNFGAVIASLDKPIELIRRSKKKGTLKNLVKEHPTRVYDLNNYRLKQVQAFSGEGVYAFDKAGSEAHVAFLSDVLKRSDDLNGSAPTLNLMTFYLVPLAIAQGNPREIARKISGYFSAQGFLTNPLSEMIQEFNHTTVNELAKNFESGGSPRLSLNAGFVDETIYGGVEGDEREDFAPVVSQKNKSSGVVLPGFFPKMRNLAMVALMSLMPVLSAISAPLIDPPAPVSIEASVSSRTSLEAVGRAVQAQDLSNKVFEQELKDLIREVTTALPLTGNVTERFDVSRRRAALSNLEVASGVVERVARQSLARQLSVAWETHERGQRPEAELRQAAFLQGLAGRPSPADGREEFVWTPLRKLFGVADGRGATTAWTEGSAARNQLLSRSDFLSASPAENLTTVVRVTELLEGGTSERRAALLAKLQHRAQQWDASQEPDILLFDVSEGGTSERVRRALRRAIPSSPLMDAYLSACRVMSMEDGPWTPAQVRARLSPADDRGRSLDLYTADASAIVVDPRGPDVSCRILLLEWAEGELRAVDLLGLARAALELARVVSTKA